MYEQRFGFNRRPFAPTPDTGSYYPSTLHEAALIAMNRALSGDESFALLTSAAGLGKTLLGCVLLDRLGDDVASAFLTNSHFPDRSALLQAILYDLGLPYDSDREQILRLQLTE